MFSFRVDGRSGVPTYLQLVEQVRRARVVGELLDGDRLPPVRELAADRVINPNTVAKAYKELERAGLARARPGLGTFVIGEDGPMSAAVRVRLSRRLRSWVLEAQSAGLAEHQIRALIATVLLDCEADVA